MVAGFKRFNSVLLRLVSNCGEEGVGDRDRIFLTLCGELGVSERSCNLVVDVEVGGLRWGEVRWLSLGEPLPDLVTVEGVIDEPLCADLVFL